jgi:stearoyl-CoA desaturase (delta-9 desaturase)
MSAMPSTTAMPASGPETPTDKPRYEWVSIAFLLLTPLIGVVGTTLYTIHVGFQPWMLGLCAGLWVLIGMSICAGYHRHFSHKTYDCAKPVQLFYAVFGAMAAQNSALIWSASHRRHHKHVDDDWDPYNIKRGFWWAHILWIFYHVPADLSNVPDLTGNRILQWQQRWYKHLLIIGGLGIPTAIGALFGDPIAGLLWGGFLRIVLTHHSTFFVNSLAHTWGTRRYDPLVSACDNWAVALLTLGEGYHSFHHRFPNDYRNGVHWYQWDPAKWWIRGLELLGLARRLRRVPDERIEAAEMAAAVSGFEQRLESAPGPVALEVRRRLDAARAALDKALTFRRRELKARSAGRERRERAIQRLTQRELSAARQQWRSAVRMLTAVPQAA